MKKKIIGIICYIFLTQKAISQPNGPITAPQGGPAAAGLVDGVGGDVVLIAMPPTTTSTIKVDPRTNATSLFCEKT